MGNGFSALAADGTYFAWRHGWVYENVFCIGGMTDGGGADANPPVVKNAVAVMVPWIVPTTATSSFTAPDAARTRLPAPTDVGVAWDRIGHRGQLRWECRAVPSGWFVMTSLCAKMPRVDIHWPGNAAPPGWDGVVHGD